MVPILIGVRAVAGPATPHRSGSATTSRREGERKTMAILLRQAIRDRDELGCRPGTRRSGVAAREGGR